MTTTSTKLHPLSQHQNFGRSHLHLRPTPTTMPLYKLTSKRLARKEKAERIAAKAEDSDASSVSDIESEDSIVLSDEDGECANAAL